MNIAKGIVKKIAGTFTEVGEKEDLGPTNGYLSTLLMPTLGIARASQAKGYAGPDREIKKEDLPFSVQHPVINLGVGALAGGGIGGVVGTGLGALSGSPAGAASGGLRGGNIGRGLGALAALLIQQHQVNNLKRQKNKVLRDNQRS